MPRIVTSNALTPRQWCLGIPDMEHLSPSDRLSVCSSNALAIMKRSLFVHVQVPLIERHTRTSHHAGFLEVAASKMRRILGRD